MKDKMKKLMVLASDKNQACLKVPAVERVNALSLVSGTLPFR